MSATEADIVRIKESIVQTELDDRSTSTNVGLLRLLAFALRDVGRLDEAYETALRATALVAMRPGIYAEYRRASRDFGDTDLFRRFSAQAWR